MPWGRADLALELIRSFDTDAEAGTAEAWDAEIGRRGAEVDAGVAETMTVEEYRAHVRDRRAAHARVDESSRPSARGCRDTPDGSVKVLDFGIAKMSGASASQNSQPGSDTVGVDPTQEGMILGTAASMSAEQARGLTVDQRTDI
jgi:Putative addiction module component